MRQLDALGRNPTRLLVRLPKPADDLVYQFTAHDPGPPPMDYLFSLSVAYRTDEETLRVYDCDILKIEV